MARPKGYDRPRMRLRLCWLPVLVAIAGCGGSSPPPAAPPSQPASHLVLLMLENKEQQQVIGSGEAPYLDSLAREYGVATESYAILHPSLPNYIILTSGSAQGIRTNCTNCKARGPNIIGQLEAKGLSWKAYLESVPKPCYQGAQDGLYVKKHNPFAYYPNVIDDPRRCRKIVSFRELSADLTAKRLPTFSYIAPNLCHDMHDCSIRTGDTFLSKLIPRVIDALGPHGFLVITFDEGITEDGCCGHGNGGRIPTIVAGPDVAPGTSTDDPVNHYGVLATMQDALGLKRLGAAKDRRSGSLDGLFRRPPRITDIG